MAIGYRACSAENLAALKVWKLLHYSQVYLLVKVYGKIGK